MISKKIKSDISNKNNYYCSNVFTNTSEDILADINLMGYHF